MAGWSRSDPHLPSAAIHFRQSNDLRALHLIDESQAIKPIFQRFIQLGLLQQAGYLQGPQMRLVLLALVFLQDPEAHFDSKMHGCGTRCSFLKFHRRISEGQISSLNFRFHPVNALLVFESRLGLEPEIECCGKVEVK